MTKDVLLWRGDNDEPLASCPIVPHLASARIEWHGVSLQCEELANSVLVHLFDQGVANRHSVQFMHAFITPIPRAGGTILEKDVRDWIAFEERKAAPK